MDEYAPFRQRQIKVRLLIGYNKPMQLILDKEFDLLSYTTTKELKEDVYTYLINVFNTTKEELLKERILVVYRKTFNLDRSIKHRFRDKLISNKRIVFKWNDKEESTLVIGGFFDDIIEYTQKATSKIPNPLDLECRFCSKVFKNHMSRLNHERNCIKRGNQKEDTTILKCRFCKKKGFKRSIDTFNHMLTCKDKEKWKK